MPKAQCRRANTGSLPSNLAGEPLPEHFQDATETVVQAPHATAIRRDVDRGGGQRGVPEVLLRDLDRRARGDQMRRMRVAQPVVKQKELAPPRSCPSPRRSEVTRACRGAFTSSRDFGDVATTRARMRSSALSAWLMGLERRT